MGLILFTLIIIAAAVVIVWAISKLLEKYSNIKAEKNKLNATQRHGIVYNKVTGEIEADNATITPY